MLDSFHKGFNNNPRRPLNRDYVVSDQEEDLDEAAVHLLHAAPPPGALPLGLDELAGLEKHHGPVGVGRDVLLNEVLAGRVLYVLPCVLHWRRQGGGQEEA